jgi:hypothetical protein
VTKPLKSLLWNNVERWVNSGGDSALAAEDTLKLPAMCGMELGRPGNLVHSSNLHWRGISLYLPARVEGIKSLHSLPMKALISTRCRPQ